MKSDPSVAEKPAAVDLESRRAALKAAIEAEGCPACKQAANSHWPVTDDLCECAQCGQSFSGSYLHICRTGAWNGVCGACNECH